MRDESELQDIVDAVSLVLQAPVTLEDTSFRLLAFARHYDAVDAVRLATVLGRGSAPQVRARFEEFGITAASGPLRIPAFDDVLPRVCLPARSASVTYGYLWGPDLGQSQQDLEQAMTLADTAGRALARSARQTEQVHQALRDVLTGDRATAHAAAAVLVQQGRLPARVRVVIADGPFLGALGPVLDMLGEHIAIISSTAKLPAVRPGRHRGSGSAVACADAARSLHEARCAMQVSSSSHVEDGLGWEALGAYRLLAAAPSGDLVALLEQDGLRDLLQHPELARTARSYLDNAGSVARTAHELALHRQSLYARLSRISTITGLDLDDGRHRTLLHLFLLLAGIR